MANLSDMKQFSIEVAYLARKHNLKPQEVITGIIMSLRNAIKTLDDMGLSTPNFRERVCDLIRIKDVKEL